MTPTVKPFWSSSIEPVPSPNESDPPEISQGVQELECFLETLPLRDNNAVFGLCCKLCGVYERKAVTDGARFGARLMIEITE